MELACCNMPTFFKSLNFPRFVKIRLFNGFTQIVTREIKSMHISNPLIMCNDYRDKKCTKCKLYQKQVEVIQQTSAGLPGFAAILLMAVS